MGDPAGLIERLRPLHPPTSDGMTEILVMWAIGCLFAAALTRAGFYVLARRRPVRRAALAALAASRALPAPERLAAQARLLRDVARASDPGAAALRGDDWLQRLDALFGTRFFSDGPGRAFGDMLYQPRPDDPAQALDDELAGLLTRLER
jgi:hypothetical protein